jgi:hypothetical protein
MTVKLVGAGVGRTGTHALKTALELLLGGTCHHMMEVVAHPEEIPVWERALLGEEPEWHEFLAGYEAIVDFPGAALWRELADAFPEAPLLLSTRSSAEEWWQSASSTIFASMRKGPRDDGAAVHHAMARTMLERRFTPRWPERSAAIAAYEAHNRAVREAIPPERLFEYRPGDGWGPLCAALSLEEPAEPFPHTNTRSQFRAFAGLDP